MISATSHTLSWSQVSRFGHSCYPRCYPDCQRPRSTAQFTAAPPQHFLYFFPKSQGHVSSRSTFGGSAPCYGDGVPVPHHPSQNFVRLVKAGLSLEVHPCGKRQQNNHSDPEGRIAHSCFLSHEPHFKPDIASMRNRIVVDIRPQPSEPGIVSAGVSLMASQTSQQPRVSPLRTVIMDGDAKRLLLLDQREQPLDAL